MASTWTDQPEYTQTRVRPPAHVWSNRVMLGLTAVTGVATGAAVFGGHATPAATSKADQYESLSLAAAGLPHSDMRAWTTAKPDEPSTAVSPGKADSTAESADVVTDPDALAQDHERRLKRLETQIDDLYAVAIRHPLATARRQAK